MTSEDLDTSTCITVFVRTLRDTSKVRTRICLIHLFLSNMVFTCKASFLHFLRNPDKYSETSEDLNICVNYWGLDRWEPRYVWTLWGLKIWESWHVWNLWGFNLWGTLSFSHIEAKFTETVLNWPIIYNWGKKFCLLLAAFA